VVFERLIFMNPTYFQFSISLKTWLTTWASSHDTSNKVGWKKMNRWQATPPAINWAAKKWKGWRIGPNKKWITEREGECAPARRIPRLSDRLLERELARDGQNGIVHNIWLTRTSLICWSTSNHQNINFLVLGRGMSNLLQMFFTSESDNQYKNSFQKKKVYNSLLVIPRHIFFVWRKKKWSGITNTGIIPHHARRHQMLIT